MDSISLCSQVCFIRYESIRNGLSTTLPNKSLLNGLPSPKKSINTTLHAYPAAKPSDCSFSGGEILEENKNQSHVAATSDSDLPKASEFIALTRSGSEKYTKQQIHRVEKLGRMEAICLMWFSDVQF